MHDVAHQPGNCFFDSAKVEAMICEYQRTGSTELLGAVISRCQPITESLIRSRATFTYEDEDELVSIVNAKLLKSLRQYSATRGTAFSFVSRLTVNMLATTVTYKRKMAGRFPPLEDGLVAMVPDERVAFSSQVAVDDLVQQIRLIKSACTLPAEREAQKWYIESFLDAGFELRRHEYADAAMKVYNLTHRRARDLYDLTILSVRQTLWTETKHREVDPNRLKGTKGTPLLRYTNFLTKDEFSKFVNLMRDLAPLLVVLVKPANEARMRAGEWDAVRENLVLVLKGDPAATPLF
jgi:hypothetical protein